MDKMTIETEIAVAAIGRTVVGATVKHRAPYAMGTLATLAGSKKVTSTSELDAVPAGGAQ